MSEQPPGRHDVPRADPAALVRLRADLAPWTVDAVETLLGQVATAALAREEPLPAVRVVEPLVLREPVAALVAAFVLGRPVPRRALDLALPRTGTDGAVALGLARAAGSGRDDEVAAAVDLRPYAAVDAVGTAHWWVASDLGEAAVQGPLRRDHVLGVGGASVMLARSTVRPAVGRALDLGTGCGVQSLHLARHARHVTATDVSARALAFARFTLALNGVAGAGGQVDGGQVDGGQVDGGQQQDRHPVDRQQDHPGPDDVRLLRGNLLEPVSGERFDLVVSNPPFVITPRTAGVPEYEYRDGGRVGDDLVRDLVTDVGRVLAPGGTAQFLANWEHRRGEPWAGRLEAWLDASGLDGWVVQREVQDPAQYAEMWIRDAGEPGPRQREGLYRAWLEDFERRDVEAVGFGLVTLRAPGGSRTPTGTGTGAQRLRRVEDVPTAVDRPLGEHLAACLAAHDWLSARDDAALLGARLTVAPDVTEERHHRPGDADPAVLLLRQGGGFGRVVRAGTALAGLVGACDGQLPVGALTGALATLLEVPEGALRAELLPAVRGLVADGLLVPPDLTRGA